MRKRQSDFFAKSREHGPRRISHGGEAALGLRKIRRPLDRRRPVHIVLRSEAARGRLSLRTHLVEVDQIVRTWARHFRVKLHHFQNVGNHLHLVASFKDRSELQNFLRTVSALIARKVTGARKGRPFGQRFWDHLAFSRVVSGWKDLRALDDYVERNRIEAEVSPLARKSVEEYERARKRAVKRGCDIWEILDGA